MFYLLLIFLFYFFTYFIFLICIIFYLFHFLFFTSIYFILYIYFNFTFIYLFSLIFFNSYFIWHIGGKVTDWEICFYFVRTEAGGEQTCSLRRGVGGSSFKLPVVSCSVTKNKTPDQAVLQHANIIYIISELNITFMFITLQIEMVLGLRVVELQKTNMVYSKFMNL